MVHQVDFPNKFGSTGELEKYFVGTGAQIRHTVSTNDVLEVTVQPDNEGDFVTQHATYVLVNGEYVQIKESSDALKVQKTSNVENPNRSAEKVEESLPSTVETSTKRRDSV